MSVEEVMIPCSAPFDDGTVDPRGHSEVVGINDEPAHGFSVASKKMGPRNGPYLTENACELFWRRGMHQLDVNRDRDIVADHRVRATDAEIFAIDGRGGRRSDV